MHVKKLLWQPRHTFIQESRVKLTTLISPTLIQDQSYGKADGLVLPWLKTNINITQHMVTKWVEEATL